MITIRLAQDAHGADHASAEAAGKTFRATSRNGVTMKLARTLMADGVPDQPWEAYGATGPMRMSGPSIFAWAKWTMLEGERGLRRVPYEPNTRFPVQRHAPDRFSS